MKTYFWTKQNGVFTGGIKFGEKMPGLNAELETHLLNNGWISETKPVSFDASKVDELAKIKEANKKLVAENGLLKTRNKSLVKSNNEYSAYKAQAEKADGSETEIKDLKYQISVLEADFSEIPKTTKLAQEKVKEKNAELVELNMKIEELEKQLEEATKPGGK